LQVQARAFNKALHSLVTGIRITGTGQKFLNKHIALGAINYTEVIAGR